MLLVVSPAKKLDYETALPTERHTQPLFLDDAMELIEQLKPMEPHQVSNLMGISDKLGQLNAQRYQDWQLPFTPANARQAVLAFKGDVYEGMEAYDFAEKDLDFAQDHLRILSGLYGALRPLDLMQPYRLEMGTRFENRRGKDLYAFWGDRITDHLNELLGADDGVLMNLASNEYFKSVNKRRLQGRMITPQFRDWRNGRFKMISFYAKKARGMMASYIIRNRITDLEKAKHFDMDGYAYNADLSEGDNWVFTRGD
ncbi:MAG: peroxide stress protein YaaA [Halomonadaceae bacterium]|nr:MAG: peroxide stress protein YaaA [Halomonadaceae bacterium]